MRLIDKDELRKKALIVDDLCEANLGFYIIPAPVFDNAPIVDAVEVVRCKDCEHYLVTGKCNLDWYSHKPDDYCSDGKRRSSE